MRLRLQRLVTPAGGVVLDLFMGSGSTGKAAMLEGYKFIGIERDEDENGKSLGYMVIAAARIARAYVTRMLEVSKKAYQESQLSLF